MEQENKSSYKVSLLNVIYILKLVGKASPFRIFATHFRIIAEHSFYVFFFVYLTQYIFTAIETNASYQDLVLMITIACFGHIGIHILSAWYTYYTSYHDPNIYRFIFHRIIEKAKELPLVKFEQPEYYDKYTRALDEAVNRAFQTLDCLARFFAAIISGFLTMLLIIKVDSILLLFTIVPIISSLITGRMTSKLWYEMDKAKTRSNRVISYTKRVFYEKKYASEIRLYNIKELLFKKHREAYDNHFQIDVKYRKKILYYSLFSELVYRVFMYFGTIIYIIYQVTRGGNVLVAPYLAMINAVASMSDSMEWAIYQFIDLIKQGQFIQNIKDFLEHSSEESVKETANKHENIRGDSEKESTTAMVNTLDSSNTQDSINTANNIPYSNIIQEYHITQKESLGDLELRNVSFTYEGASEPVINNISLKIRKGEKIALVGHNGAGKTTIVKLLMGLYDVTEGEIIAGGKNIKNYKKDEYHKQFGVIFQDFQIFALPLGENVLMRTPRTQEDRDRVIQALKKAQFEDKLKELKHGIETLVTKEFDEEGMGLSGGEAQKIAIARVFAKDCEIAILDEPSSALDPIAEFNMYQNMMEVAENKTVIFISHRLSSARMADKIYMLEHGRIIEQGTHTELMELNQNYAQMFELQAKNYKEEEAYVYE